MGTPPPGGWADLTDAGACVGVLYYEVQFRDSELARVRSSGYRIWCRRLRGDSGQSEAKQTSSAISDTLVDGSTLEWKMYRRTNKEYVSPGFCMSAMKTKEWKKNAWYVSKQVAARVDNGPVLKEYTNGRLSETAEKLFILNFYVIKCCWNALENSKSQVPGAAYFR